MDLMQDVQAAAEDRILAGQLSAAQLLGFIEGRAHPTLAVAAVRLSQPGPGHFASMRVEMLPGDICRPGSYFPDPSLPWVAKVNDIAIVEAARPPVEEAKEEPAPAPELAVEVELEESTSEPIETEVE